MHVYVYVLCRYRSVFDDDCNNIIHGQNLLGLTSLKYSDGQLQGRFILLFPCLDLSLSLSLSLSS